MLLIELNILTLNIWGIPFVSSDRVKRIEAISIQLNSGKYDIVSLQEVWSQTDVQTLTESTSSVLPYSHYFYSGVIGSGLLVLSKYPITSTLFHGWSVNGYFHRVQHADWFGGKGVGLCKIEIYGLIIHLYNTHLHAVYNDEHDEYKTHRVIQAFDTAQFIEATRGKSALQILAGDLNSMPTDISYKILLQVSKMTDCCTSEHLSTNECKENSYTSKKAVSRYPNGIRIDHIFIRNGDEMKIDVIDHILAFPDRVPEQKYSYSDHEAVLAKLRIRKVTRDIEVCYSDSNVNGEYIEPEDVRISSPAKRISLLEKCTDDNEAMVIQEAINLCDKSLLELKKDRILYYSIACILLVVLVVVAEVSAPNNFGTVFLLLKFFVFGLIIFSVYMGSIWNFMERNGVLSGKMSMKIELDNLNMHKSPGK